MSLHSLCSQLLPLQCFQALMSNKVLQGWRIERIYLLLVTEFITSWFFGVFLLFEDIFLH